MKIAVALATELFHVGTMHAPKNRRTSLEGHFLSVSRCPQAWSRIARLGDGPLWKLTKTDARLLDVLETPKASRKTIVQWGLDSALLTPISGWRTPYFDENGESQGFFFHDTLQKAQEEVVDGDGVRIRKVHTHRVTEALVALTGAPPDAIASLAEDFVFMAWAQADGLDGLYWRETYDPDALSAPRGCLFEVAAWTRRRVGRMKDDEELLDGLIPSAYVDMDGPSEPADCQ